MSNFIAEFIKMVQTDNFYRIRSSIIRLRNTRSWKKIILTEDFFFRIAFEDILNHNIRILDRNKFEVNRFDKILHIVGNNLINLDCRIKGIFLINVNKHGYDDSRRSYCMQFH